MAADITALLSHGLIASGGGGASGLDLTALTLTVLDNLDGTVDARVDGCGAGAAVRLLRAAWNHQAGGRMPWTAVGDAAADGSGVATFAAQVTTPGFYVWAAARLPDACDALSATVFRPVIDAADATHARILDAVVTIIQSLNLAGITAVEKRWVPAYLNGVDEVASGGHGLPQVQVGPYPRELPMDVMTNRDDVGYPVLVAFFAKTDAKLQSDIARNLKWRRQVAAAFRAQQLAGVPEVVLTTWQPEVIADIEGLKANYAAGALSLIFRAREVRGLVP